MMSWGDLWPPEHMASNSAEMRLTRFVILVVESAVFEEKNVFEFVTGVA
jgi:hypothetical protein